VPVPVGFSVWVAGAPGFGKGPGIAESSGRGVFPVGGEGEGVVPESEHPTASVASNAVAINARRIAGVTS
jgi:hypothetical protein